MATQTDVQKLIQGLVPGAVNNGNPGTVYNVPPPTMDEEGNWFAANLPSAASITGLQRAGVALPQGPGPWTPPAGQAGPPTPVVQPVLGPWVPPSGWNFPTAPTLPPVRTGTPAPTPARPAPTPAAGKTPAQVRAEERATGGRGTPRTEASQRYDNGLQLWASAPPATRSMLSNPNTVIPGDMRSTLWEGIKDIGGSVSNAVKDFFTNEHGSFTVAGLVDVLLGPGNQVLDETGAIDWGGVAAAIGGKINPLLGLLIRFIDSRHESAAEAAERAAKARMRQGDATLGQQQSWSGQGLNHFGFGTPAPRGNFGTPQVTVGPIETIGGSGAGGGGTLNLSAPPMAVKNRKQN